MEDSTKRRLENLGVWAVLAFVGIVTSSWLFLLGLGIVNTFSKVGSVGQVIGNILLVFLIVVWVYLYVFLGLRAWAKIKAEKDHI